MKQKECLNMLMVKIRNNEDIKLDLKNDVILNLKYNEDKKAYEGYWIEEDKIIGTWTKETLVNILNDDMEDLELIL